jgi:histidine phosphotransferase ChpT
MSEPAISALVSARLCHDLISPIGAIGNGLELLQMSDGASGEAELGLISESLGSALARLRFYRVGFGPTDTQARQSLEEARQITNAMYHGRFSVDWIDSGDGTVPRATAQLAYLAILCFERSLPMGGEVRVIAGQETIEILAEDCRVIAPDDLWLHVTSGAPVADPRPDNVQFLLLRRAITARSYRAERRFSDRAAELRLIAPAVARAMRA